MAYCSSLFLFLANLSLFSVELPEPAGAEETTLIQDDLLFVENLARYYYFDLACDYTDLILSRELTLKERQTTLLTKGRVFALQAEHEGDFKEKRRTFDQAIKSFKGLLGNQADDQGDHLLQVELAGLLCKMGRFCQEEASGSPMSQEAINLRKRAEDAFGEAIVLLNEAARNLQGMYEAMSEAGDTEAAEDCLRHALRADYRMGLVYYHWAHLFGREMFNHQEYLKRAIITLDDYAWERFREEFRTQWAYLHLSMAYLALGEPSDALDYALAVVNEVSDCNLFGSVKTNTKQSYRIQELLDSAYLQVAKLQNELGNHEKAHDLASQYRIELKSLGIEMGSIGKEVTLEEARACFAMGMMDQALEITREITGKAEGEAVNDEARIFLFHLVLACLDREEDTSNRSPIMSPDYLFNAAQGGEIEKNYFQAIRLYHRVLRSLEQDREEDLLSGRSWLGMGQCFLKLHRPLEASVAFEIGFTDGKAGGDDAALAALGYRWFQAAEKRLKQTHDHPFDIARYNLVRETLRRSGYSTELPAEIHTLAAETYLDQPMPPFGSEEEVVFLQKVSSPAKYPRRKQFRGGMATQRALEAGLDWLKRHQDPNGFWDCDGFELQCTLNRCNGPGSKLNDVGVTGLALLAFLGRGNTPWSGPYHQVVRRGLKYLCDVQDPEDGCIPIKDGTHYMYNHAIACLALTEGYGLSRFPPMKKHAEKALDYIHATKNPGAAWRYNDGDPDPVNQNDVSVTGWMIQCLASANDFGLPYDKADIVDALGYIDEMTDPATGRTGYKQRGSYSDRERNDEEIWPAEYGESMTALAMWCRVLCGIILEDPDSQEEMLQKGGELLLAKRPKWGEDKEGRIYQDYYYWYFGSYAMFQLGGDEWEKWKKDMIDAVVENQRTEGCEKGSWDPQFDPWGDHGGRVYSTALAVLTLEVFNRYDALLGSR